MVFCSTIILEQKTKDKLCVLTIAITVIRVQYIYMYYIVALGNPGLEYKDTRHNVGFLALDFIVNSLGLPKLNKSAEYSGRFSEGVIEREEVMLLCPETFMNHSGVAVKKMVPQDSISNLIVLYDDIALPFGEIKVSFDRGHGGHNGLKSIINALGSREFIRVRIGIAPTSFWTGKTKNFSGDELSRFVLSKFTKKEQEKLNKEVFPIAQKAVVEIVKEGHVKAMNVYN